VTSKGGTTERAIGTLDEAKVMEEIIAAVRTAAERAHEIGERFGSEP
jgi:pyrroline-5-carboxylate reductase